MSLHPEEAGFCPDHGEFYEFCGLCAERQEKVQRLSNKYSAEIGKLAERIEQIKNEKTPEEKAYASKVRDLAESFLEVVYNHRQDDGCPVRWRVNYKMSTGQIMPLVNIDNGELAKAQMRGIMTDFFLRMKDLK